MSSKAQTLSLRNIMLAITAIVFVVVVFFMILGSGIVPVFTNVSAGFIRVAFSFTRGLIISLLWGLWSVTSSILLVYYSLVSIAGSGGATIAGVAAVEVVATEVLVGQIFTSIPLVAPVSQVSVGYIEPVEMQDAALEIGSQSLDCYTQFGAGSFEPLWGVDPPNPRTCAVVKVGTTKTMNMTYVLKNSSQAFGTRWRLGSVDEPKIYLYCKSPDFGIDSDGGFPEGAEVPPSLMSAVKIKEFENNVEDWSDCKLTKGTVYVMYTDIHPFDSRSYGSNIISDASGSRVEADDFEDLENDIIVLYVEVEKT